MQSTEMATEPSPKKRKWDLPQPNSMLKGPLPKISHVQPFAVVHFYNGTDYEPVAMKTVHDFHWDWKELETLFGLVCPDYAKERGVSNHPTMHKPSMLAAAVDARRHAASERALRERR